MSESIGPDVHQLIRTIRGKRVILDADLARIYGVPTFRFNEAVKRNRRRFPEDFLFQLTAEEHAALTSQIAIIKIRTWWAPYPSLRFHGTWSVAGRKHS